MTRAVLSELDVLDVFCSQADPAGFAELLRSSDRSSSMAGYRASVGAHLVPAG